jgi:hypothetical protein
VSDGIGWLREWVIGRAIGRVVWSIGWTIPLTRPPHLTLSPPHRTPHAPPLSIPCMHPPSKLSARRATHRACPRAAGACCRGSRGWRGSPTGRCCETCLLLLLMLLRMLPLLLASCYCPRPALGPLLRPSKLPSSCVRVCLCVLGWGVGRFDPISAARTGVKRGAFLFLLPAAIPTHSLSGPTTPLRTRGQGGE